MNSVSVNRSSDINIVFTQHMMASTLNSSNVIVNGVYSGVISSNINYNAALRKLTVDPLTEFKAGEKILVTLKSGIKTENNIPINPFIYSFIGEVTGSTNNYQISDIISNCENVEPGDIDRDGDIDLITSFEASGIRIYKNNGSGFFSYYSQISGGTSPFILNDFDLDGDLDIVYGASDVTIRFYLK
ncbi:MAG: VCBS repeat-containing protein [Ignavibacteria bacterium]|nr:VCBS repeat-containing protein [Ignavibacteria bacterium]